MPLANFVKDRARLVELEPQIKVLEHTLAAFRLEELTIMERLNAYKYPVLTLPNEIIGEIFLHFLPQYPVCPPLAGLASPILLTHICRSLREIAFATPKLWRAISLSGMEYRSFNPEYMWLSRAGCCPLSICMNETANYHDSRPNLLAAILPNRVRCEYLQLRLNCNVSALPTIEGEFPVLRHLDIELDRHSLQEIQFLDAPMLRSVVLDGLAAEWVTRLPWTQLTSLSLHSIAFETCVAVLQTATNLLYCRLDMTHSDTEFTSRAPAMVFLPCLKSLEADVDDSTDMDAFLHSFTLPALSSLTICGELLGQDGVLSLMSLIARSGSCNLEYLRIACTPMRLVDWNSYRLALPSIRTINFSCARAWRPLHLLSDQDT